MQRKFQKQIYVYKKGNFLLEQKRSRGDLPKQVELLKMKLQSFGMT
jgi:hypothetical protein